MADQKPKQKVVKAGDAVVAFPATMDDGQIAQVLKTFRDSAKQKQVHTRSGHVPGVATEESEHVRQLGNVPSVSPDWDTLRQAVSKATEPTLPNPNTTPTSKTWQANKDAAWNAGVNALNVGGNVAKYAARMIFGVVDLPPQLLGVLEKISSSDPKISEEGETELLSLHPGAQMADYVKQTAQNYRQSKSLATEKLLGDAVGMYLLSKTGDVASDALKDARMKRLNAEGVVLPPEAKPQSAVSAGTAPPTIEGQFTQSPFEQIEAAASMAKPAEAGTTKYKYGNTQADIPADSEAAKALTLARNRIASADLAGKGAEAEPHITVRYGIDGGDTAGIRSYLEKQPPFEATLGKTTAFPPSPNSDGAAPIVVAIDSPELHRMENEIDQHGNFIDRTFPEYKPHATLAYVKPEAAEKYVGLKGTEGKKFTVNSVTISKKDGTTEEVPLKGKPPTLAALKQEAEALKPTPIEAPMNLKYTGAGGAQPFYLKSERILADKMRGPMPASDVGKMLQANGVKEEEMKYTGLDDFLKEKGNSKVTPQEIGDFNDTHDLQIEEVHKTTGEPPTPQAYSAIENWGESQGYGNDVRTALSAVRRGDLALGTGDLEMLGAPDDLLEPFRNYAQGEGGARYGSWQMAGGHNYRELLLTLPYKPKFTVRQLTQGEMKEMIALGQKLQTNGNLPPEEMGKWKSLKFLYNSAVTEGYEQQNRAEVSSFKSPHWDEPNVVGHARFNDRTGPNGEHLLHVEELQSDWAAKGRHGRFVDPQKPWSVTGLQGQFATMQEAEALADANNIPHALVRDERTSARPAGAVPDMPWKSTGEWVPLMLKRMLKYAVDNGYDGITFTPGEEQAARYDLSKQVDHVEYFPEKQILNAKKSGHHVLSERVPPEKLPDMIGKEAARKLLESPLTEKKSETDYDPHHVLSGADLKVGGEGMKGFYDKIVPDALNKIAKKFGTKVVKTHLQVAKPGYEEWHFDVVAPDGRHVESYRTMEEAERDAARRGTDYKAMDVAASESKTVPYLPITPEMRAGVKAEPFALFKLLYKPPPASDVQIARQYVTLGDVQRELNQIGPPPEDIKANASQKELEEWKERHKAWLAKAQPWLDRYKQVTQDIENLRNQDIGQIRMLPDKTKVLYLNRAGLNALYHGIASEPSPDHTLGGVSLSVPYVKAVAQNLMTRKPPLWKELMDVMFRAMDKNGVIISAIPEKGQSVSDALAILREELNHGWQKVFADQAGNHLKPEAFAQLNQDMPQAMSDHLHTNYPEITNDGSEIMNRRRVLEASSKMLSEAPQKLGLTLDEAAAYLFEYFHAVEQEHGAKALEQLTHITKFGREVKNAYFQATGRANTGSREGGGTLQSLQKGRSEGDQGNPPQAGRGVPEGTGTSLDALKKQALNSNPAYVRVTDPEGMVHTFPNEKTAAAFRQAAGIAQ